MKINSVLSRLVVALSLLLGAGLTLVQPCAAASFQFDATGACIPHAFFTRRRCCPAARCSSQEATGNRLSRARNSMIRQPALGRPRAVWPSRAMLTQRRCCPTAGRLSRPALTLAGSFLTPRSFTNGWDKRSRPSQPLAVPINS